MSSTLKIKIRRGDHKGKLTNLWVDGDSFSMIIVFKQCLEINGTLRDENVIKLNKERYRV